LASCELISFIWLFFIKIRTSSNFAILAIFSWRRWADFQGQSFATVATLNLVYGLGTKWKEHAWGIIADHPIFHGTSILG